MRMVTLVIAAYQVLKNKMANKENIVPDPKEIAF